MICETKVGYRLIKVRGHFATILKFSSGEHGKKEMGEFAFWTAVLKKKRRSKDRKRWIRRVTGRAQVGYSAGDRFDRTRFESKTARDQETRDAYHHLWYPVMGSGKNIAYIRPSTLREVRRWLAGHTKDAPFRARSIRIGGKSVKL